MKKLLLALAVIGLVGCDNSNTKIAAEQTKPSIASLISSGKEEKTYQCDKGSVSLKCEFLSGDISGSGKWIHSIVYISKSGSVDLTINGEKFYPTGTDAGFHQGVDAATFKFKGMNKNTAEVSIEDSNARSVISIDAWHSDDKKFLTTSNR